MSPSRFRLRRVFRGTVQAMAKPFIRMNVHPTSITYISLLSALAASLILIIFQNSLIYAALVFLTGLFDGVDGAVARATGKSSPEGAFADSAVDKVGEILILIPIAIVYDTLEILGVSIPIWVMICSVSWLLVSYTRSRAESLGIEDLDVGLGARSERLFILVVFAGTGFLLIGLVVATLVGIGTAGYRYLHYSSALSEEYHNGKMAS